MSDKSNVKLNIRSPALKGLEVTDNNESLRDAVTKKMLHKETFDEAWERILSMKNSNPDERRLEEVKEAMEKGEIGRDPDSTNKRFSKAEALRMHAKLAEIKREGVLKELVDNTPDNYVLVDSRLKIAEMNSDIKKSELIAFDIETFGENKEDALDPYEGRVAGFSVTANGNNYYVPLNHKENPLSMTDNEIIDDVKDVLEDARTVMHNAPFDCKWMYIHYKVDMITNLHADTRIMAMALDENRSHRLKDLLTDWMGEPSDNFDELFPETNKFNEIPLDVALVYAAGDTEKTLKLYDWVKSKVKPYNLEQVWKLIFNIEMPVARTFIRSDLRGIKFDIERSKDLDEYYAKEQRNLERKIFRYFGKEINLNSPSQKSEMLFGKLGLTDLSGKGSTAQKFLKRIEGEHEVVKLLLEHSELGKLRSSFTQKLPSNVKKDGRIHPSHNTWGAKTGRFTCSNPEHLGSALVITY